jgi:hypothetical protein
MSDQPSPYEQLQISQEASFEEIQAARDALLQAHLDDERSRTAIEAAYDAILMDRLRLRQEGKIKVPEGIRFAERLAEQVPKKSAKPAPNRVSLQLQQWLDQPQPTQLLLTTLVFAALAGLGLVVNSDSLALLLALGVGFNLVWLNRKTQRLGRAFLITLVALMIGAALGGVILGSGLVSLGINVEAGISVMIFVLFWLVSNFIR